MRGTTTETIKDGIGVQRMDGEKLFDEKLKKRIKEENVIVPPGLNETINSTLHNLPVKRKVIEFI